MINIVRSSPVRRFGTEPLAAAVDAGVDAVVVVSGIPGTGHLDAAMFVGHRCDT